MPSSVRSSWTRVAPRYASATNSRSRSPIRRATSSASRKRVSRRVRSPSHMPMLSDTHPASGDVVSPSSKDWARASHPPITAPSPTIDPYM